MAFCGYPLYMSLNLVRIARNSWVSHEHRRELLKESKKTLRRPKNMTKRKHCFVWMVMVLVTLKIPLPLLAMDDRESRSTLRGLRAVCVQVENLDPELKKELKKGRLTEETLQTVIERKLEVEGIKVLSCEEFKKSDFAGMLYVNVRILVPETLQKYTYTVDGERVPKGGPIERYLYRIDVEFRQTVSLLRDPSVKGLSTTWSTGSLGFRRLDRIRADVTEQIQTFISAYTSLSPK